MEVFKGGGTATNHSATRKHYSILIVSFYKRKFYQPKSFSCHCWELTLGVWVFVNFFFLMQLVCKRLLSADPSLCCYYFAGFRTLMWNTDVFH